MRRLPISTTSPSTTERTPRAVTLSRGPASVSARPRRRRGARWPPRAGAATAAPTPPATASSLTAVPSIGTTSVTSGRPDRERAGLVHREDPYHPEGLELCAALHQHAMARRLGDARQDRRWRPERQRARRGRHQERHAAVDAGRPRPPAQQRRCHDQHDSADEHERHEHARARGRRGAHRGAPAARHVDVGHQHLSRPGPASWPPRRVRALGTPAGHPVGHRAGGAPRRAREGRRATRVPRHGAGVAGDKTGTLTRGRPEVTDIVPIDGSATALLAVPRRRNDGRSIHWPRPSYGEPTRMASRPCRPARSKASPRVACAQSSTMRSSKSAACGCGPPPWRRPRRGRDAVAGRKGAQHHGRASRRALARRVRRGRHRAPCGAGALAALRRLGRGAHRDADGRQRAGRRRDWPRGRHRRGARAPAARGQGRRHRATAPAAWRRRDDRRRRERRARLARATVGIAMGRPAPPPR